MKRILFIAIPAIFLILVAIFWLYIQYGFSLFGDCGRDILSKKTSPSNLYTTEVQLVNCGATSDYSTQVVVKNLVTATQQTVLSLKGDVAKSCQADWQGDYSLRIVCGGYIDEIYSYQRGFEQVSIEFGSNIP